MPQTAVLLSGGYSHPFAESSPALASLIEAADYTVRIEETVDGAIASLADAPDLLAVNTLRWSMTQNEKYAPDRDEYAYHLSDACMDAIAHYVARGGRLFVLHVATIAFDTQPRWREVMGGGWRWGHSHHPPFGEIEVALTPPGEALSNGPSRFVLLDEAYHNLDPAPDCTVLATCAIDEGPQPLAWVRRYRQGRVAVDALGHDARSIRASGHRELIAAQIEWLKGKHNA